MLWPNDGHRKTGQNMQRANPESNRDRADMGSFRGGGGGCWGREGGGRTGFSIGNLSTLLVWLLLLSTRSLIENCLKLPPVDLDNMSFDVNGMQCWSCGVGRLMSFPYSQFLQSGVLENIGKGIQFVLGKFPVGKIKSNKRTDNRNKKPINDNRKGESRRR